MASATKNFHLPLSEALYNELRFAAREVDQPATRFAQDLMRAGLEEWRRARRRQEIAAYARQVAGSSEDLDPELERAGIQALVKNR
jgi:ubiquinone biosynthesis protein UbiJ